MSRYYYRCDRRRGSRSDRSLSEVVPVVSEGTQALFAAVPYTNGASWTTYPFPISVAAWGYVWLGYNE